MLLTGTFTRALDDKLRLAIPKSWREALKGSQGARLYLAPGTDGSLCLYTEESLSRLAERLAEASPAGQEVRAFSRLFYARAQAVELDSQGRVRIPPELAQLATLEKEVVLIGVQDRLEIWDRKHWDAYLAQRQPSYDEIAEAALGARGTPKR